MKNELDPIVGSWYAHLDKGQIFRVVDMDPTQGLVELQHFDADLEEIELAEWRQMDLELSAAPEDVTGPLDEVERDDLGYTETNMKGSDWSDSLNEFPDKREAWEIDDEELSGDDPGEGLVEQDGA